MALDNAANFAKVTVSQGYDSAATSIALISGDGAKLPTVPFNAVWWNVGSYADPSDDPNREIVRVTANSSDTLTITRAQEGTSASTKNTGNTYKMIAGLTAKTINTDLNNYVSSFAPYPFVASSALTWGGTSISHAGSFFAPEQISASFIRVPMVMTTNSTTYGTTGASLSASVAIYSTFNAVVYGVGTGANSRSAVYVASGSAGATQMNSMSVAANGTQYSITQFYTYPVEGQSTNNTSFGYSISNTNYSFVTTGFHSLFTGSRFIDIPFATRLDAGAYWMVMGMSTSSATNSTGISLASQANVRYSNHYGISQANLNFGVMGSTNLTSGGLLGAGSFSTAGGGTTTSFPMSAISSSASNPLPYWLMIRSA